MESTGVLVAVGTAGGHSMSPIEPRRRTLLARFFSALGPGLITGAADDDPSGIATYSAAGALLGTTQLWIALVTWPLMAAVQLTCARVAMATGKGLAGALRKKLPRSVVMAAAFAPFIANTFNIAADLAEMADAVDVRLYCYCVHCSSGLVGRGPRYVCPIAAHNARGMGNAGWRARDNNQPLPIFLAGITGRRG